MRVHQKLDFDRNQVLRAIIPRRRRLLLLFEVSVAIFVGVLCVLAGLEWLKVSTSADQIVLATAFILGLVAVIALVNRSGMWLLVRILPRHFRAARHCACCAYTLQGCPPEDDGCTVCPECGAAWKLPDAKAPATNPPVA